MILSIRSSLVYLLLNKNKLWSLQIRCTAHIHDVYWKSTEKSIEEERHQHNVNSVNTFSDDYFDSEDDHLIDRSDTYTTHIKGKCKRSASNNNLTI